MKYKFLLIKALIVFLIIIDLKAFSQTATNFTCNDCSGTTYDLFTELDAGKIVVICWVMPCGSCVNPTTTTYNVVESFQTSHPNNVYFYLADDFANTNCTTLDNWATDINIPASSFSLRFSNTAINMAHYNTFGMPKVVVLGGSGHAVFYNADNTVNQNALTDAINNAIAATGTNENNLTLDSKKINIYPNPSNNYINIKFNSENSEGLFLEIYSTLSLQMSRTLLYDNSQIDCSELAPGLYRMVIKNSNNHIVEFSNFMVVK